MACQEDAGQSLLCRWTDAADRLIWGHLDLGEGGVSAQLSEFLPFIVAGVGIVILALWILMSPSKAKPVASDAAAEVIAPPEPEPAPAPKSEPAAKAPAKTKPAAKPKHNMRQDAGSR